MPAITLVRITNPSQPGDANYRTLHLVHQDEVIDIEPGEERIVPLEIAQSFFGHTEFTDLGRDKVRTEEFLQKRFEWGYQTGAIDALEDWARKAPPFKVLTLAGEYLPMVLDDPEGKLPLPGAPVADTPATSADTNVLKAAVEAQQAQIDQLLQLIAAREVADNPGVVPEPPAPADAPVLNPDAKADPTALPKPKASESGPKADGPRQPSTKRSGTTLGG